MKVRKLRKGGEIVQITVKIKLEPTREQISLIQATTKEYIRLVNHIAADFVKADASLTYTSKAVAAELSSAVKNQAIRDAKSVFKKYKNNIRANAELKPEDQKEVRVPILKKPVSIWNNQNWTLAEGILRFPVLIDGMSHRVSVPVLLTDYQHERLKGKLGALRITQKSGKWIAQIAVGVSEKESSGEGFIGVDLGLKCPAVAVTDTGKTRFFGNGRLNKVVKRRFRSARRQLGKLKKVSVIRKRHDKEQRWMKDQDHKISRQIVNFAKENNVAVIRLEQLSGIRQTARTSRKNAKNLHSWSFYRLALYVRYKAQLMGIRVEYVDPRHTSQTCPRCKELHKAKDRDYRCSCGYRMHRDRLGAINILSAPVIGGNSLSA
ncbi:MAG: RNA-guided endonuclease InsQ/TnpB family protein [Dethiobacter sp.]